MKRLSRVYTIIYKLLRQSYRLSRLFLQTSLRQADRASGGILGILIYAIRSFIDAGASQAAASIAYYALFSLFPLLLLLITFSTSILQNQAIVEQVLTYTATILPTAQALVRKNIEQVLALRSTVGIAAGISLVWSATAVFDNLVRNIELAWHGTDQRNFFERRMVGLMIIVILATLPLLSVGTTTFFGLLSWLNLNIPLWEGVPLDETLTWQIVTRSIPWFLIFVMFFSLYRWIPTVEVRWTEAIGGALLAASAWEITKFGFTWFLSSGLARYQLVYGSLGTVVALMLWIYLSSVIILFGAHLSAAITHYNKKRRQEKCG